MRCRMKYMPIIKSVCFIWGKFPVQNLMEDYKGLCDYILEHDTLDGQEGVEFYDSRVFQVAVNHFPVFWNV